MNKFNNKGAALIISFFVMSVLVTLSVAFAALSFNELFDARRYRDSMAAFWLAETGITLFEQDTQLLDKLTLQTFTFKNGSVTLSKDDTNPAKRVVTATGSVGGVRRNIQIDYPASAPEVFNNTISAVGNIVIAGNKATIAFNDKTRLSGSVVRSSRHSSVYFEDRQTRVKAGLVSLTYPDANQNGVQDEFDDFVQFNRNILSNYPKSEIVYIPGDDPVTITPDKKLKGKKIIYIEGNEGEGNVTINYTGTSDKDEDLTVISTGKVIFNQVSPQVIGTNSQLNIIAWSGYTETAALPGSHKGMTFTHGMAEFDEINESSVTYGGIVANEGITFKEVWSNKTFNYADTRTKGQVPPGFEGLLGTGGTGYSLVPSSWREI